MVSRSYQGIFFDLFGTLIRNVDREEFEHTLSQIASTLSVPSLDFVRLWNETWNKRSAGFFPTPHADIEHICRMLEARPQEDSTSRAVDILGTLAKRVLARTRKDALETLEQLRESGYKTGLISNCAAILPSVWAETSLADRIDVPIFSCSVRLRKPDPAIYKLACMRLDLSPENCVFIADGNERELSGASQVGMHPILFFGPDEDPNDEGLDRRV